MTEKDKGGSQKTTRDAGKDDMKETGATKPAAPKNPAKPAPDRNEPKRDPDQHT